jgi:hypothetical protein
MNTTYKPGVVVVYRKHKVSTHPGRSATDLRPAANGDTYDYAIDKYWRVDEVLPSGLLVVRTRRGKRLTLDPRNPALRRPSWWEWLWTWHRFPPLAASPAVLPKRPERSAPA